MPLLPLLEKLSVAVSNRIDLPVHFPVQRVARQDGSSSDDFCGYQGWLESGCLHQGEEVIIQPSGKHARISAIYNPQEETSAASTRETLTITLDRDIDISRGDSILSSDNPSTPNQNFPAILCWFDETPLNLRRKYLLKQATQTTAVRINEISYVWNVHTLRHVQSTNELKLNDIGSVSLKTQQQLTTTAYTENPAIGSFILIDDTTNDTVAAGIIRNNRTEGSFNI